MGKKRPREDEEKADERVRKIPLKNKDRDHLIEKLQTTNIEKTTTQNLIQLTKLLYKEEEEDETDEIEKETKKYDKEQCEMCEKKKKKKKKKKKSEKWEKKKKKKKKK